MSLRSTLKRSWPVLVAHGVFSMWGIGCLGASLVLSSRGGGMTGEELGVLIGVLVATVVGHLVGSALGLAHLRLAPVIVVFTGMFIAATLSGRQ